MVLVTPVGMLYWFRRRGWLASSVVWDPQPSLASEAAGQKPQRQGDTKVTSKKFHRWEPAAEDDKGGSL
jgi:hypothetical protein